MIFSMSDDDYDTSFEEIEEAYDELYVDADDYDSDDYDY